MIVVIMEYFFIGIPSNCMFFCLVNGGKLLNCTSCEVTCDGFSHSCMTMDGIFMNCMY